MVMLRETIAGVGTRAVGSCLEAGSKLGVHPEWDWVSYQPSQITRPRAGQLQPFLVSFAQGLSNQVVMSGNGINLIGQPSTKPSLARQCDLIAAFHVQAESVEMHILPLYHSNHRPAECLKVAYISLTLTQITRQHIIKTGSRSHWFCC